jgi:hypothetical protein
MSSSGPKSVDAAGAPVAGALDFSSSAPESVARLSVSLPRHLYRQVRADSKCQLGPGLGCRFAMASSAVMSCITACMPARID